MMNTKNVLRFIIIFQYIPRLFLIFPLSSQIVKATGVVTETAWAGAAYNLMLYMLASHVSAFRSEKLYFTRSRDKSYLQMRKIRLRAKKKLIISFQKLLQTPPYVLFYSKS